MLIVVVYNYITKLLMLLLFIDPCNTINAMLKDGTMKCFLHYNRFHFPEEINCIVSSPTWRMLQESIVYKYHCCCCCCCCCAYSTLVH